MSDQKTDTVIGEDIVFKGTVRFQNCLRVKGFIKGSVQAEGDLVVEEGGKVEADVNSNSAVVNGTFLGNVEAKEKVEIGKTGTLIGDIKTPKLHIETGAKFTGHSSM